MTNSGIPPPNRGDLITDETTSLNYLPDAAVEEAYNQGSWAYSFGIDNDRCPYAEDATREAWHNGYNDAARCCSYLSTSSSLLIRL